MASTFRDSRRSMCRMSLGPMVTANMDEENLGKTDLELPLPAMNVCIMVVGTHGDVNPFCELAKALQAVGHRVRIATHGSHRKMVTSRGIEYYPMAGDPRTLSGWMVETGGSIWGEARRPDLLPEKNRMVLDMMRSSWPAATEADPEDTEAQPFLADAIISNPPVIGHIHVAEALGVPCHIMFPQPWYYGTKDFPHPMAGMEYVEGRKMNMQSYTAFEALFFTNFSRQINQWRHRTLKLPAIYAGAGSTNQVVAAKLPFSAMWSPAFVPKPKDWPKQCAVVGAFFNKAGTQNFDTTPFKDLEAWIDEGPPPIFLGFGSMVIPNTDHLVTMIRKAAHATNLRMVVQTSWSKLEVEDGSDLLRNIVPCPHDWLLPKCCAVIHHGGAGTTAAGLRFGKPTFICPFFADQFMWGFFVERAGVGPKAVPVTKLDANILAEKLKALASHKTQEAASKLAAAMELEDGIQGGLEHWEEHLMKENMLCDVSQMLGEYVLARYEMEAAPFFHPSYGIKVSPEVVALVRSKWTGVQLHGLFPTRNRERTSFWYTAKFRRHAVATHDVAGHIKSVPHGCVAGLLGLIGGVFDAPAQFFYQPDEYARSHGAFGCLFGLVFAAFAAVFYLFSAVLVLFDRVLTGIANGVFGKNVDYVMDPRSRAKVYNHSIVESETQGLINQGIPKARRNELSKALNVVINARIVYEMAKPHFHDHRHFPIVRLSELKRVLGSHRAAVKLGLTAHDITEVCRILDDIARMPPPSVRRAKRFAIRMTKAIPEGNEDESHNTEVEEGGEENRHEHENSFHNLIHKIKTGWEQNQEEAVVSFSCFILALRSVCAAHCMDESRRNSMHSIVIGSERDLTRGRFDTTDSDAFHDVSEYLQ